MWRTSTSVSDNPVSRDLARIRATSHVLENCGRMLFAKDTICSRNSVVTMM
jgi:hypothetical protein